MLGEEIQAHMLKTSPMDRVHELTVRTNWSPEGRPQGARACRLGFDQRLRFTYMQNGDQ
jgi:hypothetical protein